MVKRALVVFAIIAIGGVAPARAWCEATCLAAVETSESHCGTHDPADDTATISAGDTDACPVLESARPTVSARLDVNAAPIETHLPAISHTGFTPLLAAPPHSTSSVFARCIPLRI